MAKSFGEGLDELADMVGSGHLVGTVNVDQVYAQYQHEGLDLKHPKGGQARFLADPLNEHFREYLSDYAGRVLEDGGQGSMADSMEKLSDEVEELAPREFDNLAESGHPVVQSDGETVYDRPAKQRRLSEEELKEQRAKGKRHRVLHPELYGGEA